MDDEWSDAFLIKLAKLLPSKVTVDVVDGYVEFIPAAAIQPVKATSRKYYHRRWTEAEAAVSDAAVSQYRADLAKLWAS